MTIKDYIQFYKDFSKKNIKEEYKINPLSELILANNILFSTFKG